jgi:ssRNA-specific RNase YbeY (16S rRNA maturation enzyme)
MLEEEERQVYAEECLSEQQPSKNNETIQEIDSEHDDDVVDEEEEDSDEDVDDEISTSNNSDELEETEKHLGDIVISPSYVLRQCVKDKKDFEKVPLF